MPIQPKGSKNSVGFIELDKEYTGGLKDLGGFSHIYLIYHFHEANRTELTVTPFMDDTPKGVFATRSPLRPSHIGLSITKITSVKKNIVHIEGIDILDGTPLLDIKPYIPQFEDIQDVKTGWMTKDESEVIEQKSDKRFL